MQEKESILHRQAENETKNRYEIVAFERVNSNDMDIQTGKLQLMEWLGKLSDTAKLKRFITLKKEQEKDWWDQLNTEERSEIEGGLAQADKGEVISHKEAMAKYKKWR